MTAVFSHGRLRLYLLKLLAEGPKHGYELIRLLENRFLGLYAPSAGTIYPRLARMEVEGLVGHTAVGGRKVYEITDRGRAELAARQAELDELESEIHASVADLTTLAGDIEREVSGSVRDIKRELREATRQARNVPGGHGRRGWEWDWDWARGQDWSRGRGRSHDRDDRDDRDRDDRDGRDGQGRGAGDGRGAGQGRGRGRAAGDAGDASLADLARVLGELGSEVGRMARERGVSEADIRAATAVVVSALTELRRLLR